VCAKRAGHGRGLVHREGVPSHQRDDR
jgi:hypothetical protein